MASHYFYSFVKKTPSHHRRAGNVYKILLYLLFDEKYKIRRKGEIFANNFKVAGKNQNKRLLVGKY